MTAQKNESSNREISNLELTRGELDQVSGGSAASSMTQAQAAAAAAREIRVGPHR
jgi:hypothetical protein